MPSTALRLGRQSALTVFFLTLWAWPLFLYAAGAPAPAAAPAFWKFADQPPMGWNSWDCFGTTVTEAQTKAEADYMAKNLKDHGWQYIVVDIEWYEAGHKDVRDAHTYLGNPYLVKGERYRGTAQYSLDEFGRGIIPLT